MPELNNINIHSEEVQEIMGKIPGWIIRWGLTLVFLIFALIITGSYFFKYPMVVSAPLVITTFNTPAILEAKTGGKIDQIFVANEEIVQPGQVIAIIENPANYKDVLSLESDIEKFNGTNNRDEYVRSYHYNAAYSLGELQIQFSGFQKNRKQFKHYLNSNHLPLKINFLEQQIIMQNEIYQKQREQLRFQQEDLKLVRQSFGRDSALYNMGTYAISKAEYERSRQGYIQKQASFIGFESSLKTTEAGILKLKETLVDLQLQLESELNQYRLNLDESLQSLIASVEQWKEQYVLTSPIAGKVTYTMYWSNNQVIKPGERFATIVPFDETRIIAKAILPHSGFGKVEKGQKVNIKLNGFPFMEFGMLEGRITAISLVPEKEGYIAEIEVVSGMTTSYSEQLKFVQEMDGTADIITKDTRAIYRFISPLRALFDKGF